jgi:rhamnosyltransferase
MEANAPEITVGIPTRDAMALLPRLVGAVRAQCTGRALEILGVDYGSTDGTVAFLRDAGARVVETDPAGFNWGLLRDRLFAEARGRVVVHLSQDAIPAGPDWLERLTAPLDDPEVGASCGTSIPDPERTWPQFPWEKNGYFYFTREMRRFRERHGRGLSFANTAVRRAVWEEVGIGPQSIGEDFRFQQRLQAAGYRVAFPADAPVLHHHDYTLGRAWIRCRNEGAALRDLGMPYSAADLLLDLASPRPWVQWLREARRGSLRTPAAWLYPAVRPLAVWAGNRTGRGYLWYDPPVDKP